MTGNVQSQSFLNPDLAPPRRPWLGRLTLIAVSVLLLSNLVAALMAAGYQIYYDGHIFPGVSVWGVDLSGMDPAEAAAALEGQFTYPQNTIITLRYGEMSFPLTAAELGVRFDAQRTVQAAYERDHVAGPAVHRLAAGDRRLAGDRVQPGGGRLVPATDRAGDQPAQDGCGGQRAGLPGPRHALAGRAAGGHPGDHRGAGQSGDDAAKRRGRGGGRRDAAHRGQRRGGRPAGQRDPGRRSGSVHRESLPR